MDKVQFLAVKTIGALIAAWGNRTNSKVNHSPFTNVGQTFISCQVTRQAWNSQELLEHCSKLSFWFSFITTSSFHLLLVREQKPDFSQKALFGNLYVMALNTSLHNMFTKIFFIQKRQSLMLWWSGSIEQSQGSDVQQSCGRQMGGHATLHCSEIILPLVFALVRLKICLLLIMRDLLFRASSCLSICYCSALFIFIVLNKVLDFQYSSTKTRREKIFTMLW